MKATPPARALVFALGVLDHYWGLIGLGVVVVLEAVVFAPRGMVEWMIGAGIVGAALLVVWLVGDSSF